MNSLCKLLPLFAACALTTSANAAILNLSLLGNAGIGLLPGNEIGAVTGVPGSGGEIGAGITFDDVSNLLTINVGWGTANSFANLTGTVTGAHIHGPASIGNPFGTNAGVVVNFANNGVTAGYTGAAFVLNTSASTGSVSGSVTLDATTKAQLLANQLYINIHTATNSGGEIRGNMIPEPGTAGLLGLGLAAMLLRRRR